MRTVAGYKRGKDRTKTVLRQIIHGAGSPRRSRSRSTVPRTTNAMRGAAHAPAHTLRAHCLRFPPQKHLLYALLSPSLLQLRELQEERRRNRTYVSKSGCSGPLNDMIKVDDKRSVLPRLIEDFIPCICGHTSRLAHEANGQISSAI